MRCAVAIFAKTPGLSPAKTRLAADIGQARAEAFYRMSVDCVEAFVSEAGEAFPEMLYPVWVVAEEEGPQHWMQRPFPAIWTGEGGLGARLANVSEHLFENYDAVMMIGTDSPQLESRLLVSAASMLAGGVANHVAGPAADGGFYLFASRAPIPRETWEAVAYSASTTLKELENNIGKYGDTVSRLSVEQDVDTLADLATLREQLEARETLSVAQLRLLEWMNENSDLF